MNKKILIGIGIFAIIAWAFFISNKSMTGNVVLSEDSVKIPLSSISTKAKFLYFDVIEYFLVKSDSGSIKTAFNACDVCYKAKKGYRQEGKDMVCNNCGNHYKISGLGTQNIMGGGCWPGYLKSKVDDEYLVIKKEDLEKGRYRFS